MTDSILEELKKVADKALNSRNVDESILYLTKAFSLFSKESNRLKEAYSKLSKRFNLINIELDKKNSLLRKKVNQLNVLSNYLNSILKNISQGIIFIDSEGNITTYNDEAEKILEIDKNKIIFKKYSEIFSDDFFNFSFSSHQKYPSSYPLFRKTLNFENRESKIIEISTKNISTVFEPYTGMIILLTDITEKLKLEKIARRNERLKELGEMAATIAHEIRNPLGGIRGYASLLLRDLEKHSQLKQMAEYIIEGTKSLERLVNNVLHYSKPITPLPSKENICLIVKNLCKFIQTDSTFPKDIILEKHIPYEYIYVDIDKDLFQRALLNIIINAKQAIEKSGTITIAIIKNMNNITLSINDTGRGIDEKDLEKIFSPFFTTKDRGNGLGLSESYKIIEAHGGQIEVRSKKLYGTTFNITLPITKD